MPILTQGTRCGTVKETAGGSPGTHTGVHVAHGRLHRLGWVRGELRRGHQAGSKAGTGPAGRVKADLLYLWGEVGS